MNAGLQRFVNGVAERFYPLFKHTVLRAIWLREFGLERKIMKGTAPSPSDDPSVLFFTVHRCASVFMSRVLKGVNDCSKIRQVNFQAFFFLQQKSWGGGEDHDAFAAKFFSKKGYVYGPMRYFRAVPEMDSYKKILILRDPRDVLVSMYYSVAFGHAPLTRSFIAERKRVRQQTIDEYVIETAPQFFERYMAYIGVLNQPNVLYRTFKDIMETPEQFVADLQSFIGITFPEKRVRMIVDKELAPVTSESAFRHKRAAKAGTFREKLEPKTVDALNKILEEPIRAFGFSDR